MTVLGASRCSPTQPSRSCRTPTIELATPRSAWFGLGLGFGFGFGLGLGLGLGLDPRSASARSSSGPRSTWASRYPAQPPCRPDACMTDTPARPCARLALHSSCEKGSVPLAANADEAVSVPG
eukprot:scaffold87924_cov51-Phaeocystis_antarctica.AAC.1